MYTDDIVWRLNHSLAPNIKGEPQPRRSLPALAELLVHSGQCAGMNC